MTEASKTLALVWLLGLLAPAATPAGERRKDSPRMVQAPASDPARPLKLTSPTGGEAWSAGSRHPVTWLAGPGVGPVTVEASFDGGVTWEALGAVEGTDRLLWTVPDRLGDRCRVRIADPRNPAARDSSQDFRITASQEVRDYRWTPINLEAAFAPRDGAGVVVFRDRLWLLGGWNPKDKVHFPKICNSEVWSSADGAEWTLELLEAPWEGRHTAGYVVHEGRIWIVGGDANQRHYQNDVWCSEDGVRWTQVTDRAPWGPRVLHYTLAFGGRIWVIGGQTLPQFAPAEEVFYGDVWSSVDGSTWTRVTEDAPWGPRGMIGGGAVFGGRMWIIGGGTYDTPGQPRRYYNDVWSSADGANWERHVEAAPWVPRQYHEVGVFDGRLWVLEGYDGKGNRKDVWYSADGVNWYELPDTPWAPRHAASVCAYRDGLWVIAGNNMTSDVWKLTRGE